MKRAIWSDLPDFLPTIAKRLYICINVNIELAKQIIIREYLE